MQQELIGLVVFIMALFSFLTVRSWSTQRRREREAMYRYQALQRMAEMPGASQDAVAQLLRESMAASKDQPSPATMGPYQAREYYRNQTLQKLADAGTNGEAVMQFIREEKATQGRRTGQGLKLAGTICLAVSVSLAIVLRAVVPENPAFLVALIPGTVGVVLVAASFFFRSKEESSA